MSSRHANSAVTDDEIIQLVVAPVRNPFRPSNGVPSRERIQRIIACNRRKVEYKTGDFDLALAER
jgi:hypothetical protein